MNAKHRDAYECATKGLSRGFAASRARRAFLAATMAGLVAVSASQAVASNRVYLFSDVLNSVTGPAAGFRSFPQFVRNDDGAFLFRGSLDAASSEGLAYFDGSASLTTVATATTNTTNASLYRNFLNLALSDSGTITFQARFGGSATSNRAMGIYTLAGPTGAPVEIVKANNGANAPVTPLTNSIDGMSVGASGAVYYNANLESPASGEALFSSTAGEYANTTSSSALAIDGGTITFSNVGADVVELADGDVVFAATRDFTPVSGFTVTFPEGLYRWDSQTNTIATLADDVQVGPLKDQRLITSGGLRANRAGQIIASSFFEISKEIPPDPDPDDEIPGPDPAPHPRDGETQLYRFDPTTGIATVLATGDDAPGEYSIFFGPRLNAAGEFAFISRVGDQQQPNAIYDGPAAATDKVIGDGDSLFGGTIVGTSLVSDGLDLAENGDIYFTYGIDTNNDGLADQTGIARADWRLPGDANGDDAVNFDDLLVLAANYNSASPDFALGNFDLTAGVNFDDLLLLAANYNTSRAGLLAGGSFEGDWALATAVPEPTSMLALAAGGIAVLGRRRRHV